MDCHSAEATHRPARPHQGSAGQQARDGRGSVANPPGAGIKRPLSATRLPPADTGRSVPLPSAREATPAAGGRRLQQAEFLRWRVLASGQYALQGQGFA